MKDGYLDNVPPAAFDITPGHPGSVYGLFPVVNLLLDSEITEVQVHYGADQGKLGCQAQGCTRSKIFQG